jgi:hypothetical protein
LVKAEMKFVTFSRKCQPRGPASSSEPTTRQGAGSGNGSGAKHKRSVGAGQRAGIDGGKRTMDAVRRIVEKTACEEDLSYPLDAVTLRADNRLRVLVLGREIAA